MSKELSADQNKQFKHHSYKGKIYQNIDKEKPTSKLYF